MAVKGQGPGIGPGIMSRESARVIPRIGQSNSVTLADSGHKKSPPTTRADGLNSGSLKAYRRASVSGPSGALMLALWTDPSPSSDSLRALAVLSRAWTALAWLAHSGDPSSLKTF